MPELLDRKHTGMMLGVVFFATLMDGLDSSIVNVAMPTIGTGFGIDTATVSWISVVYLMILAGTLVAFARISADRGVRGIMAGGLTVFTIGSLLCGISDSFGFLVFSRIIQAIGAGMMGAAGPMCCTEHLPAEKLGFGLSIVTIGASMGFALGPALGGIILTFTTWHWIFLINVPIGTVAIPLMLKAIPKRSGYNGCNNLDIKGALLLFASIASVTYSIETLAHGSMLVASAVSGIVGMILLIVFVFLERGIENPLIQIAMFRKADFTMIFTCLVLVNMAFMGILYLIPFFGQICLGMSSLEVGFYLLLSAVVTAILGMPFARWSDRIGRKPFCVAAGLLSTIAFTMLALLAESMDGYLLAVVTILMGIVWACVGGPLASRLVEHAGNERDMASSLTNEGYYIGGAVGTAIIALSFTVFSGTGGINIQDVSQQAFIDGFVPTILITAFMGFAIMVLSILVKDD